ncbi:hypothetical protein NONI108955_16580 [Nocardia ninae]|uniref:Uncharacterized protein n=1 Tax=Nocardia ninae NBRC 108245 TaxID=1210091 RepID=A0A511MFC7_9NOCA|nr:MULTISPECIES: hypothetical protein [Nocardia]GEM39375.1 hypothetical protein NN4_38940 [Nocardia ninae NBRC 108245]
MSDEPTPTTAEVVESWNVPAGATVARRIRSNILVAIERGYDDPQLVADLAVGPLVMALGQLEVGLADARRRIIELERALAERDDESSNGHES